MVIQKNPIQQALLKLQDTPKLHLMGEVKTGVPIVERRARHREETMSRRLDAKM